MCVLDISSEPSLYVMGQSGVDFTAWLGHWGTLMLWCTVWLMVNWYLDALCGWNTQMYLVLMHWCALWLMMNSIDDYIAICTAHTLIAWCVFCFSKHYNASIHMLLKIEWRVKKTQVLIDNVLIEWFSLDKSPDSLTCWWADVFTGYNVDTNYKLN